MNYKGENMMGINIENTDIITLLNNCYGSLSTAERRVADQILEDPVKVIDYNVALLARQSDVSDATVVRMCRSIGLNGYNQLRLMLAKDMVRLLNMDKEGDESGANTTESVFAAMGEEIARLGKIIPNEKMNECARILKEANCVHIIAIGNTYPIARYACFRLCRSGVRATASPGVENFMNDIILASKDDVVVAISQSGNSIPVISGIEVANDRKIETIAITASGKSELAEKAEHVLLFSLENGEMSVKKKYSHMREVAIIDALVHLITSNK